MLSAPGRIPGKDAPFVYGWVDVLLGKKLFTIVLRLISSDLYVCKLKIKTIATIRLLKCIFLGLFIIEKGRFALRASSAKKLI